MLTRWLSKLHPWLAFLLLGLPSLVLPFIPVDSPTGSSIGTVILALYYAGFFLWNLGVVRLIQYRAGIWTDRFYRYTYLALGASGAIVFAGILMTLGGSGVQQSETLGAYIGFIFVFSLGALVLMLLTLSSVARLIRSAELGRMSSFADSVGIFLLLLFFPFGIYFLQRKLVRINQVLTRSSSGRVTEGGDTR